MMRPVTAQEVYLHLLQIKGAFIDSLKDSNSFRRSNPQHPYNEWRSSNHPSEPSPIFLSILGTSSKESYIPRPQQERYLWSWELMHSIILYTV